MLFVHFFPSLHILTDESFIHGGAWRDETQDKAEIRPALDQLLERSTKDEASSCLRHVVGVASINYRLSGDANDSARDGLHPDHIQDVLKALAFLEKEYGVGTKWSYMAIGHSCGATLAFQIAMDQQWKTALPGKSKGDISISNKATDHVVKPPVAVVGLEGIYDFSLLLRNHADQDAYRQFIEDAFGPDEEVWTKASPTSGDYTDRRFKGHLVVLAHSSEDELVEWAQVDAMVKVLTDQKWEMQSENQIQRGRQESLTQRRQLFVMSLKGTHDEVWEKGTELSRTIEFAIRVFFSEA